MHKNGKKTALPITEGMLNALPHVKVKNHGFVTFATRENPRIRLWGKIVAKVIERKIKKAQVDDLPLLPDGVVLQERKMGAVKQYFILGSEERLALIV